MKQYNNLTTKKSFTVIEVIIAIFVITAGIVGVLSLVTQTISSASLSSQRLIAAYLAQEGIEIVRNIRDGNWLEQRTNPALEWDYGLGIGNWEADYDDTQTLTFWVDPGNFLNIDVDSLYSYSTIPPYTPTKFKRKITISQPATPDCPAGDCLNVSVLVEWREKEKPYQVEAQENFYNWRQQQ